MGANLLVAIPRVRWLAFMDISVAIPTYNRGPILINTINQLLAQSEQAIEILILDQTESHAQSIDNKLAEWHGQQVIRWFRLPEPSIINAMNIALDEARSPLVLFLDDDVNISVNLVKEHSESYSDTSIWAVTGQVLQPGETPSVIDQVTDKGLYQDLNFKFYSSQRTAVHNCMAGNLSVRRDVARRIGGFDRNYQGVSYRFETDFARRIWQEGGQIIFEPKASMKHLRASTGGTRRYGNHLTSASPAHGVGDYYFALKHSRGFERLYYIIKRPFREVRTRFHMIKPWWIPVKLIGEVRAFIWAYSLYISN